MLFPRLVWWKNIPTVLLLLPSDIKRWNITDRLFKYDWSSRNTNGHPPGRLGCILVFSASPLWFQVGFSSAAWDKSTTKPKLCFQERKKKAEGAQQMKKVLWEKSPTSTRAPAEEVGATPSDSNKREAIQSKRLKLDRRLWCSVFSRDKMGQLACSYGALWWCGKRTSTSETLVPSKMLVQDNTTRPDTVVKQPLRRDADMTVCREGRRKIQFLYVRHQSIRFTNCINEGECAAGLWNKDKRAWAAVWRHTTPSFLMARNVHFKAWSSVWDDLFLPYGGFADKMAQ